MNTNKCLTTQKNNPNNPKLTDCQANTIYQRWTMGSKFKWQANWRNSFLLLWKTTKNTVIHYFACDKTKKLNYYYVKKIPSNPPPPTIFKTLQCSRAQNRSQWHNFAFFVFCTRKFVLGLWLIEKKLLS